MKTVWFYRTQDWMLTEKHWGDDTVVAVKVPDELYRLIDEWGDTSVQENPTFSGIVADWIEDHLDPTPETTRFVGLLRYIFDNRTWKGYK